MKIKFLKLLILNAQYLLCVVPDTFLIQTMRCGKLKKRAWIDLTWEHIFGRSSGCNQQPWTKNAQVWTPALWALISWWLHSGHLTSGSFSYPIHKMRLIWPFSQFVLSSKWKKSSRPFTGMPASWWDSMTWEQDVSVLGTSTYSALSAWQFPSSGTRTVLNKYTLHKCMHDSCPFPSPRTLESDFKHHMSQ